MLDIAGFRALTYDPSRVALSDVVAPPYDVIDAQLRDKLGRRHAQNFVHVDLPEATLAADRYRSAAERLAQWRTEGILRRDPAPAIYRYHQVFTHPEHGTRMTRKGVVVAT